MTKFLNQNSGCLFTIGVFIPAIIFFVVMWRICDIAADVARLQSRVSALEDCVIDHGKQIQQLGVNP